MSTRSTRSWNITSPSSGDHPQALDLLVGQVRGQTRDQLELGRTSALGRAVLDVHLDVAQLPTLARRVHLDRDRRARGEADGEQLLGVGSGVLAAGLQRLVDDQLVIADLDDVPEVPITSCRGLHP